MKKIVLIFALLSLPAFATDIPYTNDSYTSSTCDSGVLQHDSGTVRLRARYEPNQININWYDGDTEINSNSCDYGGTLTLPETTPQRTGYTFAGWHVRKTITFSSLSLSTGTVAYGKGVIDNTSTCYWANPSVDGNRHGGLSECTTNNQYAEMENHEWKTDFTSGISKGTLYGMAHCSGKTGSRYSYTWPVSYRDNWQTATIDELDSYNETHRVAYCWCKATGWKSEGQTSIKGSDIPLGWVIFADIGTKCDVSCALYCASIARDYSAFRDALFLGIENVGQ